MDDVLTKLVDEARKQGASYSEARFQEAVTTVVTVENGSLKTYESDTMRGVGVRVLLKGAWGFSSSSDVELSQLRKNVRQAIKIAKSSRKKSLKDNSGQSHSPSESRPSRS
jgi:TldD protein